jgi:hypothetical protein
MPDQGLGDAFVGGFSPEDFMSGTQPPPGQRGAVANWLDTLATNSKYPVEPDLTQRQTGVLPEGYTLDDSGRLIDKATGQPAQYTPRPNISPLSFDPEGKPVLVMPKIADLLGNLMGGSVPVKGAEMVLGAGPVARRVVAAAAETPKPTPMQMPLAAKVPGPPGPLSEQLADASRNVMQRAYFEGPMGGAANMGKTGPVDPNVQTVANPYRMMYPGIYRNPKEIAATANAQVAAPDEITAMMKQLWGVDRGTLSDMAIGRTGNAMPNVQLADKARGSEAARNIITPENTQRLVDTLAEAGKYPGLSHADAWYILDPVFHRMVEMFGPDEAVARYKHFNTMTGMASPGSDVLTELQRGTAAHWLDQQGRFQDFSKYGGVAEDARGRRFPEDMRYIAGHPYHPTSQAGPMGQYLERGAIESSSPKVPLYVGASGVPQTGFQTIGPVGDAHWSRGVGLADTRKGPTDIGASFSGSEYQTLQPWWQHNVAGAMGLESVPAQARLWTALGPQTGVESALGRGKLELFTQQIMKAAQRMGVSPEKARDLILSGQAGAGVQIPIGQATAPMRQQQNSQYPALTDHLQ